MAETDPELDKWIDQALATYTDPHDDAVSYRITAGTLDRIDHWRNRSRRVHLFELVGALAFACVLVAVFLPRLPRTVQPLPAKNAVAELKPPAVNDAPASAQPIRVADRRIASVKKAEVLRTEPPKLEQFPAPHPPSPEEQALAVFASLPVSTGKQIKQLEQGSPTPIQIPSVEIPALQIKVLDVTQ